jgi:cytochrome-b5 reductase
MPNVLQFIFVLSSLVTFASLYGISRLFFRVAEPNMTSLLPEFLQTPTGLSLLLGGGLIVGTWWLLSVKHTRTFSKVCHSRCNSTWFIGREPVLSAEAFRDFPLVEKIKVSPNTALYRFGLPDPEDTLGLPPGQHLSVSAEIDGKTITRSYTPTTGNDDLGHFDLVVKVSFSGRPNNVIWLRARWVQTYEKGNISKYLSQIKISDSIKVKGPKGNFIFRPDLAKEFGLIAGGTGITPMLQVVRYSLFNPGDPTKFSLIYANVNEEDILLKVELDYLVAMFPYRFSVYYVLNNPPAGWKGGAGFISKEHISEHLPAPGPSTKILLCGEPFLSPYFILLLNSPQSHPRSPSYDHCDEGTP